MSSLIDASALIPACTILMAGLGSVLLVALYALKHLGKGGPIGILFKDFRRKMYMTCSLGGVFLLLYLLLLLLGAYAAHRFGTTLFFLLYRHPIESIYAALFLFASLSLSIYLVRMWIKYLYLTRGKD